MHSSLPTFAIIDKGVQEKQPLCLLMEKGNFWGMGYLPDDITVNSIHTIKEHIEPFSDNDFIRKSVHAFALANPDKTIFFR